MGEKIALDVRLRGFVRRSGKKWIAVCPSINVASQGNSQLEARSSLQEAVELWFESCVERGTLEDALRECNFVPAPRGHTVNLADVVSVRRIPSSAGVLGDAFDVEVTVPAYQAALFQTPAPA
jgi:predicted RNase H-like HicB family nuclease